MRRRATLMGLASALAGAEAARAQPSAAKRRVGVLMNLAASDPESQKRLSAFLAELKKLGWTDATNLRIDVRWGEGKPEQFRQFAAALVASSPDLLVAASGPVLVELLAATRSVPIVFAQVIDPVGGGYVESLHRPGGNATGFTLFDYSMSAKWLELLKEVAPRTRRAAVLYDQGIAAGKGQLSELAAAAPKLGMDLVAIDIRDATEMTQRIREFATVADGGLIATASPLLGIHRQLVSSLAIECRLPAVYPTRLNAVEGGLIAYGPDLVDTYRGAARYADRILRGANPRDLPVQNPVKFELAINLNTARRMGLEIPTSLLARADEVIE